MHSQNCAAVNGGGGGRNAEHDGRPVGGVRANEPTWMQSTFEPCSAIQHHRLPPTPASLARKEEQKVAHNYEYPASG